MNTIKRCLTLTLALPLHAASADTPGSLLLFRLESNETICIDTAKGKTSRECDHIFNSKSLDMGARKLLQRSHELLPAFSQENVGGNYLVLIARIPSKNPQGTGYCGAGYEDHAILLEHKKQNIALRDDFLLQSCLSSISLDSNDGDDILKAVFIDPRNHSIRFRWVTDPDGQNHTLIIANEKFLLK